MKKWFAENQTLVYFLIAQAIAIGAAVLSMTAYMVRLETRVATLEVRGSPHLTVIGEAGNAAEALSVLEGTAVNVRRVRTLPKEDPARLIQR